MNRREWLVLAGSAILPGCGPVETRGGISLSNVAEAAAKHGGEGFGVWKSGRLVDSHRPGHRLPSLSITKSFAALAATAAIGEGWLSPDQPLTGLVPEWRGDPMKRRITTRMLLNQTAGFVSGVPQLYRGRVPDKGRTAISLPLADPPGERFRYGPASSEALAEVMRRALLAKKSTTSDFYRRVMSRIGLSSPGWRKDGSGREYLSTGAEFSVRELGRLGKVVSRLARGEDAAGLQAAVFQDLASPRPANPMFSAGMWWNRNAAKPEASTIEPERELDDIRPPAFWQRACFGGNLDPGWLAMVGSGGKRVYVLPGQDLVIVRLGRSRHWSDGAFLRALSV